MEDERITDQITNNYNSVGESQIVDKYSETRQLVEQGCKAASHEKPSAKQKPKTVASSQKRKESSDIVIKTEEEELEDEEEEEEVEQDKNNEGEDSDMDREREKLKVGRKKAKKTKKTKKMKKPEMKDLMVGRRMASLNASAMMQVLTINDQIFYHPLLSSNIAGGVKASNVKLTSQQLVSNAESIVMRVQQRVWNCLFPGGCH